MKKRYLILENGITFSGYAFGADKEVIAEIVFTTGMTGYLETLTDKSYVGQAVVATFPLIGNYGINLQDAESAQVGVSAYIVREYCAVPSNFRCEMSLDSFLRKEGIPGLYGIDTRALTRILREHGTMNGIITDRPENADMEAVRAYRITNPVQAVSVREIREEITEHRYKVALYDFGVKENIVRSLKARGCDVLILPCHTPAQAVLDMEPDGIFLSNGPGDPTDNTEIIENLRELSASGIPMMGICLGHQLLALSHGFKTHKLKYGHRGANHPVRNTETGRVYITSQNHGYAVTSESVDPAVATELYVNVNDGTNEGLRYIGYPICSVQFHPEGCGGPRDTDFLFDEFITMMEEMKHAAQ